MLKPKGNLKEKISAAMDRMKGSKMSKKTMKSFKNTPKLEVKMTSKPMDTMSKAKEGFDKIKSGMKNY